MTELAGAAICCTRPVLVGDDAPRLGQTFLIILPQRSRIALAVECLEIIWHFFAVDVPDEGVAPGRKAFAFKNVGIERELNGIVQLG